MKEISITKNFASEIVVPSLLAIAVVFVMFLWQGNNGFFLADEGYLWYGVQRVISGEVPIRDFMAYDPGRYYWSAWLMQLWGDNGIMALRITVAFFQAIGLSVGLVFIARTCKKQNVLYLLLSTIILMLWMYPRHKLFDISLSIFLIAVLSYFVESKTNRGYFFTGLCLGLIAVFGRNHGLYGLVASLSVILFNINRLDRLCIIKRVLCWILGIIVGFTPILLMMLIVPDFARAFYDSILFLFELKGTNLPLPVPWPWRVNIASLPLGDGIRALLVGCFFIGIVVFGVISILWIIWCRWRKKFISPVWMAASFLALPYAHYSYSRAAVGHLAMGIFPFLIGSLVFFTTQSPKIKWSSICILCVSSFWVMYVVQPGWSCYVNQCVRVNIAGDTLKVQPDIVNVITQLKQVTEQYAKGQNILITPYWPGAYSLLSRKSPIWEIYALFPRSSAFQKAEIKRIEEANPALVWVFDLALDEREELRFSNTHSTVYQYIVDNYERVPNILNPAYEIYKKK